MRHREHVVGVFYVVLLALPFAALALLSLFALLGVLAVGGAVYVAGAMAAGARYVARGGAANAPRTRIAALMPRRRIHRSTGVAGDSLMRLTVAKQAGWRIGRLPPKEPRSV